MRFGRRFKYLRLRERTKLSILLGVILIGLSVLGWAVLTGKIKIGAETVGGTIKGYIYDDLGNPLSGATISVLGNYTISGNQINLVSNSSGYYSTSGLKENAMVKFIKHGTQYPENFTDVLDGYWAQKEIAALVNSGVTKGKTTTTFDPEGKVTRAEMAVFLTRTMGLNTASIDPNNNTTWVINFSDVPKTYWAFKEIQLLYKTGVTSGCTETKFCPEDSLKRDQVAVMLAKAASLELYDNPTPTFTDVPKTHWAYKQIEATFLAGITSGKTTTTFDPNGLVTRAQMAVFLTRTFTDLPLTAGGYKPVYGLYPVASGKTETDDIYLNKLETLCSSGTSLHGRVFSDKRNGPLNGVYIFVDRKSLTGGYGYLENVYDSRTDSTGYFWLGCLPLYSKVKVNVISDYLSEKILEVTSPSKTGDNLNVGDIYLDDSQTPASLSLIVKDYNSKPITDGNVILKRFEKKFSKKIDASGQASLSLPPGTYEVAVQKDWPTKITFYKIADEQSFVVLKPGTSNSLNLLGLTIEKEEPY